MHCTAHVPNLQLQDSRCSRSFLCGIDLRARQWLQSDTLVVASRTKTQGYISVYRDRHIVVM